MVQDQGLSSGHWKLAADGAARRGRAAFSLLDLMVAVAIISLLMAVMMPSLLRASRMAQRVVCSSNQRQLGLGILMYQQDYGGELPPTRYAKSDSFAIGLTQGSVDRTVIVREQAAPRDWDGLGMLFGFEYLDAGKVYYCPAHAGDYPYSRYENSWNALFGQIVSNYQYRGPIDANVQGETTVLSDALRTVQDFNHRVGSNVLRLDMSVAWIPDLSGRLIGLLPKDEHDKYASEKVNAAWDFLDGGREVKTRQRISISN